MWYCAQQVYPGVKFTQYAVLGDDIVITDPAVAQIYELQLKSLGVTISYQKSLISDTGRVCQEWGGWLSKDSI